MSIKFPLVRITWEDSRQPQPEWQFLEDIEEQNPVNCVTVGYLIKDTKKSKLICQNIGDYDKNMQVSGIITIPCTCIYTICNLCECSSLK